MFMPSGIWTGRSREGLQLPKTMSSMVASMSEPLKMRGVDGRFREFKVSMSEIPSMVNSR
jgi:hypothetical protein